MVPSQIRIIRQLWLECQPTLVLLTCLALSLLYFVSVLLPSSIALGLAIVALWRKKPLWLMPSLLMWVIALQPLQLSSIGPYCSVDFSAVNPFGFSTVLSNGSERIQLTSPMALPLGACLEGELALKPVSRRQAPGMFNPQSYFASQGIIGRVSWQADDHRLTPPTSNIAAVRQWLDDRLRSSRHHAYWRALLLGSRSGLSSEQNSALQESQAYHLLVVSGLHIAIILLFVNALLIPLPYKIRLVCLLLVASVLPMLFGGGVSVWRASIMAMAATWMLISQRQSGRFNKLLLAAVVLVAINQQVWLNTGAWLSFAAVFILSRMPVRASLWQVQLGLLVMLWPVTWMLGLAQQPVGSLANLIWVPALTLLLPVGYLLALFNQIQWLDPVLTGFLWSIEQLPRAVWLPVPTWQHSVWVLIACWLWLLAIPGRLLLSIGALLIAFYGRPMVTAQVIALDVGQGSAIIVFDPPNALVVDTGPGNPLLTGSSGQAIVQQLASRRGIEQITLLISHDDLDHKGGSVSLLRAYPRSQVVLGQASNRLLGLHCQQLGWQWQLAKSDNDQSCVVYYQLGQTNLLITGDLSRQGEYAWLQRSDAIAVDLLVAGHHGSHTSTSSTLLRQSQPSCVWIAAGHRNPFNHPNAQVLAKIRAAEVDFRVTGWHGNLIWQNNQVNCKE